MKGQIPVCLWQTESLPSTSVTGRCIDFSRAPFTQADKASVNSLYGATANVDIPSLLKGPESDESSVSPSRQVRPTAAPLPTSSAPSSGQLPVQQEHHQPPQPALHVSRPIAPAAKSTSRRSMPPPVSDQAVKKQFKWSPEEDAIIIELRGRGMKWEDISKQLSGRSAVSCRLHYQNYLERRSEWSEERKDKLARLYERFKADMWAKVAEELAVPWRAAEAMHWQLGEAEMARRAGVVPFSLATVNAEANASVRRNSPSRGHDTHTHGSLRDDSGVPNRNLYGRSPQTVPGRPRAHTMGSHRENLTPQPRTIAEEHGEIAYGQVPMLAPIQTQAYPAEGRSLPSISELTTGITPYSGAAGPGQGIGMPNSMSVAYSSFGPPGAGYGAHEPLGTKRPASPDSVLRDASHRRRMG